MDNSETERVVYEAAVRGAQDQAAVLDGLRTRAGTVLAAAALVSSFLGGQALRTVDHLVISSMVGAAFAAFILSAVLTLAILWPFEFRFILSPRAMVQGLDEHAGEPNEPREFYRALALQLEWRYDQNARKIRLLQWGFSSLSCSWFSRSSPGSSLSGGADMSKSDQGNPAPGWPDMTKPDTRGGGNGGKK